MKRPFSVLASEYLSMLSTMAVLRIGDVDATAQRLVQYYRSGHYRKASQATGVPVIWMAASFEREASSDFRLSPAQGDRWDSVSVHVPAGRGPFASWDDAAVDAYSLDGLDNIGAGNWTMPRACYEGELFNGFGYRGHGVPSPYLWGGTSIQRPGKYVADGRFDPTVTDRQLGIVPVMLRMAELVPELALPGVPGPVPPVSDIPVVQPVPDGVGGGTHDTAWLQTALNDLIDAGLIVDGSYGRLTRAAVREFQIAVGITVDGLAGPQTFAAIEAELPPAAP